MSSQSAPSPKLARIAVAVASLWILTGALFKLFAGTPKHLPVPVLEIFAGIDPGLKLHLAIAIEFAVIALGLLAPSIGWFWVSGCLGVFVVILLRLLSLSAEECGCFGTAIKVHPGVMLGLDSACLLAILATQPWKSLRGAKHAPLAVLAVVVALGAAAPWLVIDDDAGTPRPSVTSSVKPTTEPSAPSGDPKPTSAGTETPLSAAVPPDVEAADGARVDPPARKLPRYVVLDPLKQKWVGKHIRDTELAQWLAVDDYPQDGEWILFRYTCDHCAAHFLKLDSEFASNPKMYVLVHIPDDNDETHGVVKTLPQHFEPIAELPTGTDWILETPWTLELEGGVVKRAYLDEGEEEDSAKQAGAPAPPGEPVEKK